MGWEMGLVHLPPSGPSFYDGDDDRNKSAVATTMLSYTKP